MTKLFPKLLSLTLALLMLAGCASTPATEPADPLEGTITVEPFDAEKLVAESEGSAYGCYGITSTYEIAVFGSEWRMLECAIFGTVLDIELVTAKNPMGGNIYIPSQKKYVRYKVKVNEVVADANGQLKAGQTITLFHPYESEPLDEILMKEWIPLYLEEGVTYALTFMKSYDYEYYYDKEWLTKPSNKYEQYLGDDVQTLWKIPFKDIGEYLMRDTRFHAYEVVENKLVIETWPLQIADRYLNGTKHQDQLEGKSRSAESSYTIDKDFFPQLVASMQSDEPLCHKECWTFLDMYLYKHDREAYEKKQKLRKEMAESLRKRLEQNQTAEEP